MKSWIEVIHLIVVLFLNLMKRLSQVAVATSAPFSYPFSGQGQILILFPIVLTLLVQKSVKWFLPLDVDFAVRCLF
jgi:hypothetical protein